MIDRTQSFFLPPLMYQRIEVSIHNYYMVFDIEL